MDPKFFSTPNFLLPKFFWTHYFLGPNIFLGPTNFFGPKIVKQKDFLDQTFVGPTFFDLRFFNQNIIEPFLIQIFSYPSVLDGKHFYPIFLDHKLGLKNFLTKDFVWREHYFGPDFFWSHNIFGHTRLKLLLLL